MTTKTMSENTTSTSSTSRTLRFAGHELLRLRRDMATIFFSVGLPIFFYLIFGALQSYGQMEINGGNVAAYVMLGMAFYAGVVGAVGAAGASVTDSRSGWGRQLALTPLRPAQLAFANAVSIAVRAGLPIAAVFIAGALTNAKMQPEQWALTFLACVLCSIPFGFYGLAWTLAIPKENTVGIATGSIVILAFAANMFMPLTGALLDIGRFTPMYGAMMLVRWPLAEGGQVAGMGFTYEPMWYAWVSISVWTAIFVGFCLMMRKRDKNRS